MKYPLYLFALAFFLAAPATAQIAPLAPAELAEPMISISPDYYYPFEEILYLEGRANPNAIVTVQIRKEAGAEQPVKFTVKADSSGEWVIAQKTYLSGGIWQVRARQQLAGAVSGDSNPRVIRSVVTGFNVLGLNVRYAVIGGFALAFLVILTGVFIYFRRKIARLQRGLMDKQLHETEDRFHRSFAQIRAELMGQLKDLAAGAQGRQLSAEEIEKRDRILRELEDLEQNLEHDIGSIKKS